MRHANIRTTMNIYGDVVTDEIQQAANEVAGLVIGSRSGLPYILSRVHATGITPPPSRLTMRIGKKRKSLARMSRPHALA